LTDKEYKDRMRLINKFPEKFLEKHEGKLQIEYAKIRRNEMIKRGKKYTLEKQAEIITKEWTSFTTEQKINM
jgi:hypothetical protein